MSTKSTRSRTASTRSTRGTSVPTRSPYDRYVQLRQTCVEQGLRLTPQRDVLLHAISEATGHPTVDELINRVRKVLPTVSHATVYRNVHELVRAGLIGTLEHGGGAVQFELNPDYHHHFICRRCGEVWDVYLDQISVTLDRKRTPLRGFEIDRRDMQMHGTCAGCKGKGSGAQGRGVP